MEGRTRSPDRLSYPLLEYGEKYHGKDVPDPYGGKPKDFEIALDMIEDGCKGLVELVTKTATPSKNPGEGS